MVHLEAWFEVVLEGEWATVRRAGQSHMALPGVFCMPVSLPLGTPHRSPVAIGAYLPTPEPTGTQDRNYGLHKTR